VISNQANNWIPADGLPVIGGTFNTVIGFVFLAIVLVSPDGLMGIWERAWTVGRRKGRPPAAEVALSEPVAGASS